MIMDISLLWHGLGWPLIRLIFYISLGLFFANFIESLNWTHKVAKLSRPLIRIGHLPEAVGVSFSMAFFSGIAANTMLSESFANGKINKKELILANLFNSLPSYFLHLPTVFFITAPLIKGAAFTYVGLTFLASIIRTVLILFVGRLILTKRQGGPSEPGTVHESERRTVQQAMQISWKRFKKRIKRIVKFTVPIYTIIFFMNQAGIFDLMEVFLAEHLGILSWLNPQTISIIVLHVAAEFMAGLAVAGALIDAGHLAYRDIILALLVGNVLSSPMRAVRHQFPYYAGIFSPTLALELIIYSQAFRVGSIILVGVGYYLVTG